MSRTRVWTRRFPVIAAVTGAVLLLGGPAYAHVTVDPTEAEKEGYATLTFQVPNESEDAGTTRLRVDLPTDTPISSVRTQPKPGWSANVQTEKLDEPVDVGGVEVEQAVTRVTWKAKDGVRIGPDEFEQFRISAGPLPSSVESLELPATQTYDDGEVVAWDQPMGDDGSEPENPAPVLALTEPSGDDHGSGAAPASDEKGSDDERDAARSAAEAVDNTARTLGGVGAAVGALGLLVGAGAAVASRRSSRTAADSEAKE